MARPKRSSTVLQKAEKREAGLQLISDNLDLGNALTLESYTQRIQALRSQISTYNSTLSTLDDLSRDIKGAEPGVFHSKNGVLLATDLGTDEADELSTKGESAICFICSYPLLTKPFDRMK